MKLQNLARTSSESNKRGPSLALYFTALALEAGLLLCAFRLALLESVQPSYRMIGLAAIVPAAAASAWWGGIIALDRRGEMRQREHPILIIHTLPIRILFGVALGAVVVSIFALLGNY